MNGKRQFIITPRMSGKRQLLEAEAKRTGSILVRADGSYRWDGKRWRKIKKDGGCGKCGEPKFMHDETAPRASEAKKDHWWISRAAAKAEYDRQAKEEVMPSAP